MEFEAVDDETQARFDEEIGQRRDQLRSQLDLTGRANAAFASAAGLDASKTPPELLREIEQVAERMSKDEPPPLRRELEAVDDETQARFDEEIGQRRDQLRSHLDLTGRANAAFASAAGLDASKTPPELLREIEQVAERMSKDEPPPLRGE